MRQMRHSHLIPYACAATQPASKSMRHFMILLLAGRDMVAGESRVRENRMTRSCVYWMQHRCDLYWM